MPSCLFKSNDDIPGIFTGFLLLHIPLGHCLFAPENSYLVRLLVLQKYLETHFAMLSAFSVCSSIS